MTNERAIQDQLTQVELHLGRGQTGEAGILLLQWKNHASQDTADALFALVQSNLRNPAREAGIQFGELCERIVELEVLS